MRFSRACQTRAIGIVWREALEPLKNPDCLSSARVSSAAVLLLRETRFIGKESLSVRLRAEFNAMQIHSARGELDGKALRVRFKPNLSWLELPSLAFSYHIRPIKDTLLSQLSRLSIETPRRRFSAERLNIRYRSRSFNRGGSIALWPSNLSLRQGSSREDSINNTASGD